MYKEQIERISANPKLSIAALARGFLDLKRIFFQPYIRGVQQETKKAGRKTSIQDIKAEFENALKMNGSATKRVKDKIDFWTSFDVDALTVKSNKGQLFEVDIPEDDVLLDEQKLFKDQPEVVQKAVRDYVESLEDTLENQRDLLSHVTSENEYYAFFGRHSNDIRMRAAKDYFLRRANGEAIYKLLMCGHDLSAKRASLWLNDHGIKGITYYVSEDGRCYVIFDDKAVKVLETYYQSDAGLQNEVATWEKTVDAFMADTLNRRQDVTILTRTPLVMSLLSADKDKRVVTNYDKLKKILQEKHHLPENILKQLPAAMADPIMIFDSATMKGDYVMMLDLKDENGATIVVPISLNYSGISGYIVNYVPSVYAQKNTETNHPRNG